MRVEGGGWKVESEGGGGNRVEGGERRDDVGIYESSTYYCHSQGWA